MVDDPNRKTPRQFQCRDYLWDSFEQLSTELECSIDYLINESMRHYLRAQGRAGAGKTGAGSPADGRPSMPSATASSSAGVVRQPTPAIPARQPAVPAMPQARAPGRPSMPQIPSAGPALPPLGHSANRPVPAMPQMPSIPQRSQPAISSSAGGSMGMPTAPPGVMNRAVPPPVVAQQRHVPPPVAQPPAQRTLIATYNNEDFPVTKEEFFIGRGQKLCDLVIRDTNISRQHARVVLHNGAFWMMDNGSTNGVEFRGAKIQQKRIDEGDVFTICGHDVVFQYR